MIYQVSFLISLVIMVLIISMNANYSIHHVLFTVSVAIGAGGYLCMSLSYNLEEAILANKISYVLGMFAPMLLFMLVCEISQVRIPPIATAIMYTIQVLEFLCACTIGYSKIYYTDVVYRREDGIVWLEKTYGPLHNLYLISLVVYMFGGMIVAALALKKKNMVSQMDMDIILGTDFLAFAAYCVERIVDLSVELMPLIFVEVDIVIFIAVTKIKLYSVMDNQDFIAGKMSGTGYMVFDKKLKFKGSNDLMRAVFPEAGQWEIDRKVPGSGGRFNTYLRQPLRSYIQEGKGEPELGDSFELDDKTYSWRISRLLGMGGRHRGYVVEIIES